MTIEERAHQYACENDKPSSWFNDLKQSYMVGAISQKNLDIDKACNLLCKLCLNKTNDCLCNACPILEKFYKAMKE